MKSGIIDIRIAHVIARYEQLQGKTMRLSCPDHHMTVFYVAREDSSNV